MTTFESILAVLLAAAFVGGLIWFVFWDERRDVKSAAAEMAFTTLVLGQLAESLDLEMEKAPSQVPGGEVPSIPVVTGTRQGHLITIKPTYVRSAGEGFKNEYPYSDQRISLEIQPPRDRSWVLSAQAALDLRQEVPGRLGEAVSNATRRAIGALSSRPDAAVDELLSPNRRPLYIIDLYLKPNVLAVSLKYAHPPKVEFQGCTFRQRTDPKDLVLILNMLLDLAEGLPSRAA